MFVGKRQKRTMFLSMLACVSFLALAVWSWGVPLDDIRQFLWLSLVLLTLLVVAAALLIAVLKFARWLLRRGQ